jgi:hypothetical protein
MDARAITSNYRILLIASAILVLTALWRVLVPAHEYGSSASVMLSLGVDLLLLVSVFLLRRQLAAAMPPDDPRRGTMQLFAWPAVAAGLVVLLIRFTSDHGWWTGHLRYTLD